MGLKSGVRKIGAEPRSCQTGQVGEADLEHPAGSDRRQVSELESLFNRWYARTGIRSPLSLTLYPLNLPGLLYGSPMPFGLYDLEGKLLHEYQVAQISAVVVLAEVDEYIEKARRDLQLIYRKSGLRSILLPTPNYGVPAPAQLRDVLGRVQQLATDGHHIAVHCSAGLGRTPFFAALLARRVLGLSCSEALTWLSHHKPDALLTPSQILTILEGSSSGPSTSELCDADN